MSKNQSGQEALVTGWEMIPHPSINRDSIQVNPIGGSKMIVQQQSFTIRKLPVKVLKGKASPLLKQFQCLFLIRKKVNSSSKKRRKGTAYEPLGILEKNFTLFELFNSNNIEELWPGGCKATPFLTYFMETEEPCLMGRERTLDLGTANNFDKATCISKFLFA